MKSLKTNCLIGVIAFLLFSVFALTFARVSFAGTANVTWTHPTKNTDGSAIGTIVRTEISYGICNAGRTDHVTSPAPTVVNVNFPAAAYTTPVLAEGWWCFKARTVVSSGQVSEWSNVASKQIIKTPNPPTDLTVVGTTVFTVIKSENRFVLLPVGTVPAGVECDPSQSVNGKYVVDRSAVTWSGNTRPVVVVADCA